VIRAYRIVEANFDANCQLGPSGGRLTTTRGRNRLRKRCVKRITPSPGGGGTIRVIELPEWAPLESTHCSGPRPSLHPETAARRLRLTRFRSGCGRKNQGGVRGWRHPIQIIHKHTACWRIRGRHAYSNSFFAFTRQIAATRLGEQRA